MLELHAGRHPDGGAQEGLELLDRFDAEQRSIETERLLQPYVDRAISDRTKISVECRGSICRVVATSSLSPDQFNGALLHINTDKGWRVGVQDLHGVLEAGKYASRLL